MDLLLLTLVACWKNKIESAYFYSVHQLQPRAAVHDEIPGRVLLWWEAETDGDCRPTPYY